jgi:hypothetical protein
MRSVGFGARAVCVLLTRLRMTFWGLACHLSPCMFLKLRFVVDSIPSALSKPCIHAGIRALDISRRNKSRNKPPNNCASICLANNNFHALILK